MTTGYIRKKHGRRFSYYNGTNRITDEKVIRRIEALVIPPAWKNVEIARGARAKIQATGYDTKGRKQAIYHASYRAAAEHKKFERTLAFAENLPKLRKHLEKDLSRRGLSREKVLATIVTLIDQAYFRVGSEQYARDNNTYGITTMRRKHVAIGATTVTFDFVSKSNKRHKKVIKDRTLARIIKQLDELPGYDIFRYADESGAAIPLGASDVNTYIKSIMGDEFTAKDFRTWGGTMLAASNLAIQQRAETETARKKSVTKAVKAVAKRLGNTPAVARSSYISPSIIESYMNGDDIYEVYQTIKSMRPKKYLKPEESAVIRLLTGAVKA